MLCVAASNPFRYTRNLLIIISTRGKHTHTRPMMPNIAQRNNNNNKRIMTCGRIYTHYTYYYYFTFYKRMQWRRRQHSLHYFAGVSFTSSLHSIFHGAANGNGFELHWMRACVVRPCACTDKCTVFFKRIGYCNNRQLNTHRTYDVWRPVQRTNNTPQPDNYISVSKNNELSSVHRLSACALAFFFFSSLFLLFHLRFIMCDYAK